MKTQTAPLAFGARLPLSPADVDPNDIESRGA